MDIKKARILTQIIITLVLGTASIILIFIEPEDSVKLKWAIGIIGIIIGYWLK